MTKKARLGSDPLAWIKETTVDNAQNDMKAPDTQCPLKSGEEPETANDTETRHESVPISEKEQTTEKEDPIHAFQDAAAEKLSDKKNERAEEDKHSAGGKFLTFFLAEEEYGIEILKVVEIIGSMNITKIPRMPKFIKGVINLRGKVIPVMDLRLRFGMPELEDNEESVVILVQAGGNKMGIVVDRVSEVLDIDNQDIQDKPDFGSRANTDYILSMGKSKDKVMILLDIEQVICSEAFDKTPAMNSAA
jgi:purine-binding chemotaxis protein CheW